MKFVPITLDFGLSVGRTVGVAGFDVGENFFFNESNYGGIDGVLITMILHGDHTGIGE